MNAKKAKLLRKAAGYRNQTATPGTIPFPGIMPRGFMMPQPTKRTVTAKTWNPATRKYEHAPAIRIVNSGAWSRRGKFYMAEPVYDMTIDENGKPVPKFDVMPTTKPGRLNDKQPKGLYRALKRIESKFGLHGLVGTLAAMGATIDKGEAE